MNAKTPYDTISAPPIFNVVTVIPYTDEPQYRHYEVDSAELPVFLDQMAIPQHAERVIHISPSNNDTWHDRL